MKLSIAIKAAVVFNDYIASNNLPFDLEPYAISRYFYENGIGVEKNIEKALKIYKAVAKKNFTYGGDYIKKPF